MLAHAVPAQIEAVMLELFWWYVQHDTDRLELLKIFAAQPVTRSAEWNSEHIREEATRTTTLSADECFCCKTRDRRLYWHHVVQVHQGGSNHPRNKVAICLRCHATIHPWLPKDRKGEQRGGEWWSLRDIVNEGQRKETQLGDQTETIQQRAKQEPQQDAEEEMPF